MKGVILAGGLGSRLLPLTKVTNKHLLPVYNKPMIYYPIETLVRAGVRDILIVTGGNSSGDFLKLLGNGKQFGLKHINYTYQEGEGGIAHALGLEADLGVAQQLQHDSPGAGLGRDIDGAVGGDQGISVVDMGLYHEHAVADDPARISVPSFDDEGGKIPGGIEFAVAIPIHVQACQILLADLLVLTLGQCLQLGGHGGDGHARKRVSTTHHHAAPHLIC